jgi:predicted porin
MGVSSNLFKTKLVAASVASAFALPALAQLPPEIQIYGRVNVSVEHITVNNSSNAVLLPNESNNELVDNSSRIGIRGKKDLTPGLAAIFQVESRVKLDDSAGSVFASRDSYAGLQGAFGTIRAGRTIGPVYYATYDYISMHNHDTGTSSDALLAGTVVGNQGFMNNTLWYTSPKFGPFTVDVAYSMLNERRVPGLDQPSHLGLVGAYDQGPLHLAVSYANTENTTDLNPGVLVKGDKSTAYTVGGLYDFKTFVIGALYEKATSDLLVGDVDSDYFRIAAMMPVGPHEFHVNYGWVDTDGSAGAKQYTVAYNYNITKQTKVYAFYTVVDNESGGTFGFRQSSPAVAGADFKSLAIGFRHNF